MDIEDIKKKYTAYMFADIRVASEYFGPNTVIDENKSVRWNKEECEKRNATYYEECRIVRERKNNLYMDYYSAVLDYIMLNANISKEQAVKVFSYLSRRYDDGYELIDGIDDILELF